MSQQAKFQTSPEMLDREEIGSSTWGRGNGCVLMASLMIYCNS